MIKCVPCKLANRFTESIEDASLLLKDTFLTKNLKLTFSNTMHNKKISYKFVCLKISFCIIDALLGTFS